jgi:hypothetical protein
MHSFAVGIAAFQKKPDCLHTPAYASIRQHTSAYASIRVCTQSLSESLQSEEACDALSEDASFVCSVGGRCSSPLPPWEKKRKKKGGGKGGKRGKRTKREEIDIGLVRTVTWFSSEVGFL